MNQTSKKLALLPQALLIGMLLYSAGCDPKKNVEIGTIGDNRDSSSSSSGGSSSSTFTDDDDDGLGNDVEELFDMETRRADSDQDGISDGLEFVGNNGDPLDASVSPSPFARSKRLTNEEVVRSDPDRDQDGLGDTFENDKDLDPDNPDIDGDGYSDGLELVANSDPFLSSSRPERDAPPASDGVTRTGAGPSDSDRDGLSDDTEALNGTRSTSRDTDGDGFSDGIEFLMGSDALDEFSVPNFNVPLRPVESSSETQ